MDFPKKLTATKTSLDVMKQAAQTATEILNAQAKSANAAVTKLLSNETFKQAIAEKSLTAVQL